MQKAFTPSKCLTILKKVTAIPIQVFRLSEFSAIILPQFDNRQACNFEGVTDLVVNGRSHIRYVNLVLSNSRAARKLGKLECTPDSLVKNLPIACILRLILE